MNNNVRYVRFDESGVEPKRTSLSKHFKARLTAGLDAQFAETIALLESKVSKESISKAIESLAERSIKDGRGFVDVAERIIPNNQAKKHRDLSTEMVKQIYRPDGSYELRVDVKAKS